MKILILITGFLLCCFSHSLFSQNISSAPDGAEYKKFISQAGFVKNYGQFLDEKGEEVKTILYGTHIGDCGVFITSSGFSYINFRAKPNDSQAKRDNDTVSQPLYDIERIDVVLENARIDKQSVSEIRDENNTVSYNYYTASHKEGVTGVSVLKEILLKNVYPEIDWLIQFKTNESGKQVIKYNFIVRPGGDASAITLKYSRNVKLSLDTTGNLQASTKLTEFTELAPVSYFEDDHVPVNVSYKLLGQRLSFIGAGAKTSRTLVIDPEVFWATYLPNLQPDLVNKDVIGNDIDVDPAGNILVQLTSDDPIPFIIVNPGNGAYVEFTYPVLAWTSVIMLKFSPGGQLLWSTYFAGKGATIGRQLTVDINGNVYALCYISNIGSNIPISVYDIPLKNNGGFFDARLALNFITKFDNQGVLLWCSFIGSQSNSIFGDMTTDDLGNFYIVGTSHVVDFPVVDPGGGAFKSGPVSGSPTFIMQFDPATRLIWSTFLNNSGEDRTARITIDKNRNIWMSTTRNSNVSTFVDAGGYFNKDQYSRNVLVRFNASRQMTWCTNFPGEVGLADGGITTDDDGSFYLVRTNYLVKFDAQTNLVWEKKYAIPGVALYITSIKYNKKTGALHTLGMVTGIQAAGNAIFKNTDCGGSFYFDGKNPKNGATFGALFMNYTTDGDVQYSSMTDWGFGNNVSENSFALDPNGDMIALFYRNLLPTSVVRDPGNGAYFQPAGIKSTHTAYIIKLTTSQLQAKGNMTLSPACDANNLLDVSINCGTAPFTYEWSNGEKTATVRVAAGNYTVKITDKNYLSKVLSFDVPNPPDAISNFSIRAIATHCDLKNGEINVSAITGGTSPYLFSINNKEFSGQKNFSGLDSGQYLITVKDANGCTIKDSLKLTHIPGPSAIKAIASAASCNKDDGILLARDVTGGASPFVYAVNNGSYGSPVQFAGLAAGYAILSVKDAAGCTFNSNVLIPKARPADSLKVLVTEDHCLSGIGALRIDSVYGGNSPFTFSSDNVNYQSQRVFGNLKTGTYELLVKDSKDCIVTKPVVISNIAGPERIFLSKTDAVCGNDHGFIQIDSVSKGSPSFTYSLDGNNYQSAKIFNKINVGTYSVRAKDNFGCEISQPVEIKFVKQFGIEVSPSDTTVCYGQNIVFNLSTYGPDAPKVINWSTGDKSSSITLSPTSNRMLYVSVTDRNGCVIKDTANLKVKACNPLETCIGVPNAFTPNHDGTNDAIGPIVNGCLIVDIKFQVFNRWGQLVFQANKPGEKWDGKYKSMEQPAGTYVFLCSYENGDGARYQQKGVIQLIR